MEKEKLTKHEGYPVCTFNKTDCFANVCGSCDLLTNTDFKGKMDCPFYKNYKEYNEEKKKYERK